VQKNGVYIRSDRAASFDSLPPGPDPGSISKNVHDYLPPLTKKGTLFRASTQTVARRQAEFTALVRALFAPELPVLLREIRASRTVRDFFGYWRRDADIARKREREIARARASIASGMLSHFAGSTASLHSPAWHEYDFPGSPPLPLTLKTGPWPTAGPASPKSSGVEPMLSALLPSPSVRRRSSQPLSSMNSRSPAVPASAPPAPGISFTPSTSSSDSDALLSPEVEPRPPSLRGARSMEPMASAYDDSTIGPRTYRLSGSHLVGAAVNLENPERPAPSAMEILAHDALPAGTPWLRRRVGSDAGASTNMLSKRAGRLWVTPPESPADAETEEVLSTSGLIDAYADEEEEEEEPELSSDEAADKLGSLSRRASTSSRRRSLLARASWMSTMGTVDSDRSSGRSGSSRPVSIATTVSFDIEAAFPKPPTAPALTWTLPAGMPRGDGLGFGSPRRLSRPATSPSRVESSGTSGVRRSLSLGSSRPRRSVDSGVHAEAFSDADDDSVVDAYFHTTSRRTAVTPHRQRVSIAHGGSFHLPFASPPAPLPPPPTNTPAVEFATWDVPSPASALSSPMASPPGSPRMASALTESMVVVKVAFGEHIVLCRLARDAPLADARARIAAKLAAQDAAPSSNAFTLACLPGPPASSGAAARGRRRSSSVSSLVDPTRLRPLATDEDWADAVDACPANMKLVLRVFDASSP
jgi:hypothetical protein